MAINVMMQVGSSLAGRELPGLFWSRSAATYLSGSSPHRLVNGIAGMNVSDRGVAAPVAPSPIFRTSPKAFAAISRQRSERDDYRGALSSISF